MAVDKAKKFYNAWWYLVEHRIFQWYIGKSKIKESYFSERALDIHVAKVDPATNSVNDDDKKNTKVEIWLECGPIDKKYSKECEQPIFQHDWKLDCGGDTFEDAIIRLAALVKKNYDKKKK